MILMIYVFVFGQYFLYKIIAYHQKMTVEKICLLGKDDHYKRRIFENMIVDDDDNNNNNN